MKNKYFFESLPIVASSLGNKYGIQVHIGGNEAYTDGKNIYLPTLPLDMDEKLINLARGYIDHESAHIRFTDMNIFKESKEGCERFLLNVIEDVRVEKEISKYFSGCNKNLQWLSRYLFKNQHDIVRGDKAVLNYILLALRTYRTPEISVRRDCYAQIVDKEFPKLRRRIDRILESIERCNNSTHQSLKYTRELLEIIKDYIKEHKEQSPQDKENMNESGNGEVSKNAIVLSELDNFLEREQKIQSTGEMLKEALNNAAVKRTRSIVPCCRVADYISIPSEQISILSPEQINRARASINFLSIRLQALLQAQAQQRRVIGRRGTLETQQVNRLLVGNPNIFRIRSSVRKINTAIHIVLDCSTSMKTLAYLSCPAAYAVAESLQRIKVNVGISIFPVKSNRMNNNVCIGRLLNHGDRVHKKMNIDPIGSTPLAETLWRVMDTLSILKEDRKIILVITDGEPDSLDSACKAVEDVTHAGYEIYGIGIMLNNITKIIKKSRIINNIEELAPAMYSILSEAMI